MTDTQTGRGADARVQALHAARQRDSHTKRTHVRVTIESMLLAGDPVTFTSVARTARVSTWLVYADGVREHIESAIQQQQRSQPDDRRPDDPASIASLRTDLALARNEIARLRADNDKLRRNAQRLLGQQLDQHDNGELLARVDSLVAENGGLTEKLRQSAQENAGLQKQVTELEEDIAGARTALRRMIREQTTDLSIT
jgi:septal ring factor EnvC (AmiA/AmiB activator)